MSQIKQRNNSTTPKMLWLFAISMLVAFAEFLIQGAKGFDLWDDGFLWYGVQRVGMGEVPILDFMAYDPARYYLTAAVMKLLNMDGLLGLRFVVTLVQGIGLFVSLLMLYKTSNGKRLQDFVFLFVSLVVLAFWMFPYYKIFDIVASIFVIYALCILIERPASARCLMAGIIIGVAGLMGRNHALYGTVSVVAVMMWLMLTHKSLVGFVRGTIQITLGVIIGLSPIIVLAFFNHEFAISYFEGLIYTFKIKSTNLALPIPWPWQASFNATVPIGDSIRAVLVGLGFISLIAFGLLTIVWALFAGKREKSVPPVIVSCGFLALPYAHYAFSRADVAHLALGIFPMLIGCLAAIINSNYKIKFTLLALIAASTIWVMHVYHPAWQCYAMINCDPVEISGSKIYVAPSTKQDINLLRQLDAEYNPEGGAFLATPFWPGAYALLERKSPIWEIYALLPQSDVFQAKEIEQIKRANVQFVVIVDIPLDGREDLRYKNSRALVYDYIVNNYELVDTPNNPILHVYKRHGA